MGEAHDKKVEEASFEPIQMGEPQITPEDTAEEPRSTESILKQAKRDVRGSGDAGKKIYREYTVTGEELKDGGKQ